MKAEIVGPKAAQTNPKSVDLDLHLRYLAGGTAAELGGGLPGLRRRR
jgi:hypothetical protein